MKIQILSLGISAVLFASCGGNEAANKSAIDLLVNEKVKTATEQKKANCDAMITATSQKRADSIIAIRKGNIIVPASKPADSTKAKPVAIKKPTNAPTPAPTPGKTKPTKVTPPPPTKPVVKDVKQVPTKPSNTNRPGANNNNPGNSKPVSNTNRPGANNNAPAPSKEAPKDAPKPPSNTNRPGANR
jgi:hypothetical protein